MCHHCNVVLNDCFVGLKRISYKGKKAEKYGSKNVLKKGAKVWPNNSRVGLKK